LNPPERSYFPGWLWHPSLPLAVLHCCSGLIQLLPAMESGVARLNRDESAAAGGRDFVMRN